MYRIVDAEDPNYQKGELAEYNLMCYTRCSMNYVYTYTASKDVSKLQRLHTTAEACDGADEHPENACTTTPIWNLTVTLIHSKDLTTLCISVHCQHLLELAHHHST